MFELELIFSKNFMSDVFLAYNLRKDSSYEEAIYVANQLKWSLKLTLEQSLYALYQFVVEESDIFHGHIYRYLWATIE